MIIAFMVLYILGVASFGYLFAHMAEEGEGYEAIITNLLWPIVVIFTAGFILYDIIKEKTKRKKGGDAE